MKHFVLILGVFFAFSSRTAELKHDKRFFHCREAIKNQDPDELKRLLREKKRAHFIKMVNENGFTLLHIALLQSPVNIEIVSFLLDKGADPNKRLEQEHLGRYNPFHKGWRPYHFIASSDDIENVHILCDELKRKGADPFSKDDGGWTPFKVAARYNHFAFVKWVFDLPCKPTHFTQVIEETLHYLKQKPKKTYDPLIQFIEAKKPLSSEELFSVFRETLENGTDNETCKAICAVVPSTDESTTCARRLFRAGQAIKGPEESEESEESGVLKPAEMIMLENELLETRTPIMPTAEALFELALAQDAISPLCRQVLFACYGVCLVIVIKNFSY